MHAKKAKLLCVLLTFCLVLTSYAQQQDSSSSRKVSGNVTDIKGDAIPKATVQIKGTAMGTTTDVNGHYELDKVANGATLVFSYVGMESTSVDIGNQSVVNVTLKESPTKLGEVVVVAFGTQQKYTMTSAVAQVDNSILKDRPITDAVAGLEGQVAGVNVSLSSGAPGSTASIVIRGAGSIQSGTDPLVIIDGVSSTMANMSNIDPNDIESISVLKDAAASSLYGARAANGVILVTTKMAKAGKVSISYAGYVGWQKPTELFQEANAYNYASAYNMALNYDVITPTNTDIMNQGKSVYTQAQLDAWQNGTVPSTDWRKALFSGNNGLIQSHYLDITGGISNDNVSLKNNLSLAYFQQNGNITNTAYNRYTIRDNSELNWGKFNAGISVGLMANRQLQPDSKNVGDLDNIISAINRQQPMDAIMVDGYYVPTTSKDTNNPVGEAATGGKSNTKTNNVLLNLHMSYAILKKLVLRIVGGLDYTGSTDNIFLNSTTFYNPTTGLTLTNGSNMATNFFSSDYHYMGQVDLTYNTDWGKHHFGFVIGGQEEYEEYNDYTMQAGNYLNNSSSSMQLADPTTFNNSSNQYRWGLTGVFGRFNYDYEKKYLVEFDARDDGSSRLSPNHQWNFFPSASLGWRLSQENFWSSLKSVFPEFKIRGSYGVLGNDQLPGSNSNPVNYNQLYYRDKSLIGNISTTINNGQYVTFNGIAYVPMGLIQNPDNTCTWEQTAIADIAIDGTIVNSNLSYTIDFFNKKTTGMLMTEQLSDVNGAGSYVANIGSMKNYGIEFQANYTHATSYGLKYALSANFSYLNSKVLNLGGQGYVQVGNQAGYVLDPFYLYTNDGLLTQQEFVTQTSSNAKDPLLPGQVWGDQRILDVNGNGVIDGGDRVVINKNSIPKDLFGLNFDVSWKGIGISGMIQGAADYYQYLGGSVGYGFNQGYSIATWTINNSYNPLTNPNDYNTRLPRVSIANTINYQYPSTLFLFNSSYVRLKNLQVYYEFPKSVLGKTGITELKVYVSGQNLYTISALPKALGIDPEIGASNGSNSPGSATGSYPLVRTCTVGLNITF